MAGYGTIHVGCPLCEAMEEAIEEGTMHAPVGSHNGSRPGAGWRSLPPNMPVPPEQSPTLQNIGAARQVRAYPEVPQTRELTLSGRVR